MSRSTSNNNNSERPTSPVNRRPTGRLPRSDSTDRSTTGRRPPPVSANVRSPTPTRNDPSLSSNNASYDDMLKNLDDMVETGSPSSRPRPSRTQSPNIPIADSRRNGSGTDSESRRQYRRPSQDVEGDSPRGSPRDRRADRPSTSDRRNRLPDDSRSPSTTSRDRNIDRPSATGRDRNNDERSSVTTRDRNDERPSVSGRDRISNNEDRERPKNTEEQRSSRREIRVRGSDSPRVRTSVRERDSSSQPPTSPTRAPASPVGRVRSERGDRGDTESESSSARGRRSPGAVRSPTRVRSPENRLRSRSPPSPIDEIALKEQKDLEESRKVLKNVNAAKRERDILEAEMVAEERRRRAEEDARRKAELGSSRVSTTEFALISSAPVKESLLVPEYLTALMTTLRNDKTISPVPTDFTSPEAFDHWRTTMRRTFQEILIKMIKYRYLQPPEPVKAGFEPVPFRFRVIEAQGLIGKEGRARSTYCNIEYGDLQAISKQNKNAKQREVFRTEVISNSLDPVWNQNMKMEAQSLQDQILLQVWDQSKDPKFLGQAVINMGEVITRCAKDGKFEKWYPLGPREAKHKDKYVGGQILVGASLLEDKQKSSPKSYKEIQSMLMSMQVDNRSLFDVLLRSCVVLDLFTPREGRTEVLSPEAVNLLKAWALTWNLSEAYQVISYLKILFQKYSEEQLSISDLLRAFHFVYATVKVKGSFNSIEMQLIIELLESMRAHCADRVVKYKELYPKNKPNGALESTILVLRMIHRFPTFKDKHPELQDSFRDELKFMMTESCIKRFQTFKEKAAPLDETNVESVIEGINKLAEDVNDEIELDVQYFQPAFAQELDIVRLTAESQLKYFVLTLEDSGDVLEGDEAINTASHFVFDLYQKVRVMAERLSTLSQTYVESWFAPFMYKWLHQLSLKSILWVQEAVKADTFDPEGEGEDGVPLHSSSITDVFSSIYSELEFITDLRWSDPVQNAQFFQMFAKTMNSAIEQYCDAIALAEKKTSVSAVTSFTQNLLGNKNTEPEDIEAESCAKLRNVQFAMSKLREMYKMMNVSAITKTVKNHRKSMAILKSVDKTAASEAKITGAFKFHATYAENVKPINKNGTSNPYLIVRVPEGTVVPPLEQPTALSPSKVKDGDDRPKAPTPTATVLTGNACELFRSRVVNDSLNPTWDETFTVILPPVERIEIAVFSRNMLIADEVAGTAIIDLSLGTRLRRKLQDHQTHDIYVELEPQGRVLLRLTLEGEEEDVDFWFRRTNERLIRTRDSFLRALTIKITPYASQIITKAIKENEAAVLPSKTWLASLTSAVEYSNMTAANKPVDKPASESDAVIALQPLIEYLEKNLETLCNQIPLVMAQEVITRIWADSLVIAINLLVPPLFGNHVQRHLNVRQTSMLKICISILRDFFHADGAELGLSLKVLDTQTYKDLSELLDIYHLDVVKVKREYDLSMISSNDKELLLRLVRLRTEKDSEDLKWIETQLVKRREVSARR
ncbi:hypothetical protein HDV02_002096 [Globomyces sp. JEL0801]|nr:hypothetical protein HDV02_002096 [Globomyces sp. JEL0801]